LARITGRAGVSWEMSDVAHTVHGMAKRSGFRCTECGWTAAKWVGRCGECQAWGTVVDSEVGAGPKTTAAPPTRSVALPIDQVPVKDADARPTGVAEFDRVLGGGLVPGAVMLLAGEPGVGKSTLLLAVAASFARAESGPVLYVTGEESAAQVRLRAERIGALSPQLLLVAERDLASVLGHIEQVRPELVIVDSVQTITSSAIDGTGGGVAQVREVAAALIATAKAHGIPVLLVGHVTKDGTVAGPRTLEHLVDVVCQFEGDRHASLRMLRSEKNRYGATDEVGCFELTERGITGLSDPSGLFVSHLGAGVPGSCVTASVAGRRPLVLEIQSLIRQTKAHAPRRTTVGIDSSRLAMILAVLHRHANLEIADAEVYASTVGGARATEPAVDLALALSLASTGLGLPLPPGTIALGEVGLAGDIRPIVALERRLAEAARLGFTRAIVPGCHRASAAPLGLRLIGVSEITAAFAAAGFA